MDRLFELPLADCNLPLDSSHQELATEAMESGKAIFLPHLVFQFHDDEKKFLTPAWSNGAAKNISYDSATGRIQGMDGESADKVALANMLQRYADFTTALLHNLFPRYKPALIRGRTSYRPVEIKGRVAKVTKDDTRLHPDQFPARPVQGKRIIRVFCNVNPHGKGRDWRIGEPFAGFAQKFFPRLKAPFPLSLDVQYLLRVTRKRRSLYDHYMLQLHDQGKMDDHYQKTAPQTAFSFPAQCTWLCFTDEVLHAVDAGQYLLEQTYLLPVGAMRDPEKSPLRVLERMANRPLL